MQICIANSCLSFAWWGDLHGVVCRDSKSSMVGSAPTPWWLVSRPVCREGPTFTNFAPLPGIRLHSLNQDSSCLKSSAKIWKNPFFVLLIGSLWETAILNWNPHGRCSDNFAIKPWIPPFGYIPSDFKSKPSIHPQNSFSLFPIYSIKPKNYSLSFRIRPGTCFKHG